MTKHELSQLYYLNRKIVDLKRRIEELEALATSCAGQITGMPRASGITDMLANYTVEIADLRALLELNLQKCFYELNRLNRYIESVDDGQMRMILTLRHVNGLSWQQVAESVGEGYSADTIRKAHDRFLSKW